VHKTSCTLTDMGEGGGEVYVCADAMFYSNGDTDEHKHGTGLVRLA
jgi:hypothetical protein